MKILLPVSLMILSLAMSNPLYAQKRGTKRTELGFSTNALLNPGAFRLELKRGKDDRYLHYGAFVSNGAYKYIHNPKSIDTPVQQFDYSLGFRIGLENRKELKPKLDFFQGPSVAIGGSHVLAEQIKNQTSSRFESISANASIGWRFGFMYDFHQRFYCSLEMIPALSYNYEYSESVIKVNGQATNTSISHTHSPDVSISSAGMRVGLFYKF